MQLKTVQKVQKITATPLRPETVKVSEIIEIELSNSTINSPITQEERCASLILAEIAESVGNRSYYEDRTISKLAIALTSVVEAMVNVREYDEVLAYPIEPLKEALKGSLKESLEAIEDAIDNLQEFKEYLGELLD